MLVFLVAMAHRKTDMYDDPIYMYWLFWHTGTSTVDKTCRLKIRCHIHVYWLKVTILNIGWNNQYAIPSFVHKDNVNWVNSLFLICCTMKLKPVVLGWRRNSYGSKLFFLAKSSLLAFVLSVKSVPSGKSRIWNTRQRHSNNIKFYERISWIRCSAIA